MLALDLHSILRAHQRLPSGFATKLQADLSVAATSQRVGEPGHRVRRSAALSESIATAQVDEYYLQINLMLRRTGQM